MVQLREPPSARSEVPEAMVFLIQVQGIVQGVGFRPTVWRIARELELSGEVLNNSKGVLIRISGSEQQAHALVERLRADAPALARIETIEIEGSASTDQFEGFSIRTSAAGPIRTTIGPDIATCARCAAEVLTPAARRYRYPFTNCTNCGPRYSIVERLPYDRRNTSMKAFDMCVACSAEYGDPADRRFHAEPIACPACGPTLSMTGPSEATDPEVGAGAVEAVIHRIDAGKIVAIKGLGGYHLACDATNGRAVEVLRRRKRRSNKPFALMARDLAVIRRYAHVSLAEEAALASEAAPILLLEACQPMALPAAVAPGLSLVGFALPYTPLHHMILAAFDRPLVMTSGNLSDEPQCIDDQEARDRLAPIADNVLANDRRIVNRVDDSVVRMIAGVPRLVRRARGYAPAPVSLPSGFESSPDVLALGGELKSTFCLTKGGQAILSPHLGDLENAAVLSEFERSLDLMSRLVGHEPAAVAVDLHAGYVSTQHGRRLASERGLPLIGVQHHHAHLAACLAENGVALDDGPVLGVVLDGLGFGDDGTLWGGEFLLADYRGYERLAHLKPVPMPGGTRAVLEPWRNLYAHLEAAIGLADFGARFGDTRLAIYLEGKPTDSLAAMIRKGLNSPLGSSCGRLFDAVAAAVGLCPDAASYEAEAAMRLEALAASDLPGIASRENDGEAYPFATSGPPGGLPQLDPTPMWWALCRDISDGVSPERIARRFHAGLARWVVSLAAALARRRGVRRTALSGGCFQNRRLAEAIIRGLAAEGLEVLFHARVPANDGGLALGQAAVAAARRLAG
jgi:hydrogenase maturation protein HypF